MGRKPLFVLRFARWCIAFRRFFSCEVSNQPAEAGTPATIAYLKTGWIPIFTIVMKWMGTPKTECCLASHIFNKLRSATEWPFGPLGTIPVMHGVMQNIVPRCIEVPLGFHCGFRRFAPRLSASTFVFTIPLEGCAAMQFGHRLEQRFKADYIA